MTTEQTIYEYYLNKKNKDWKSKLKDNLIKAIDNGNYRYEYCTVFHNKDYIYTNGEYIITNKNLLEVIDYIKNEGLKYFLDIGDRSYGNSTISNNYGSFVICWE